MAALYADEVYSTEFDANVEWVLINLQARVEKLEEHSEDGIATACVLWINTDGQFHVKNFKYSAEAHRYSDGLNESGLPAKVILREYFIPQQS